MQLAPFLPQPLPPTLVFTSCAGLESHFSSVPKPSSSMTRGLPGADNTWTPAQLPSHPFHEREGSMIHHQKAMHYQGISFCYFSVFSGV